jgi:hypothetical protein
MRKEEFFIHEDFLASCCSSHLPVVFLHLLRRRFGILLLRLLRLLHEFVVPRDIVTPYSSASSSTSLLWASVASSSSSPVVPCCGHTGLGIESISSFSGTPKGGARVRKSGQGKARQLDTPRVGGCAVVHVARSFGGRCGGSKSGGVGGVVLPAVLGFSQLCELGTLSGALEWISLPVSGI